MRSAALLSLAVAGIASAQTTGKLGDAAAILDNPIGASYIATLPNSEKTSVRGTITATSNVNGEGVNFAINLDGLPSEGGPFLYHLHDQPVPADGNCTKTLAHLDPYERGQEIPCDPTAPATCQVGDLSGKFGHPNATNYVTAYNDLFASLKPGIGAFFGNRSVVVHFANNTRITCANFTVLSEGELTPAESSSILSGSHASTAVTSGSQTFSTVVPTGTGSSNASTTTTGSASATTSGPVQQTVNAALNLVAPLPAVIAVAMAAIL